jgi:pyruvate formate lyase activating enzyme
MSVRDVLAEIAMDEVFCRGNGGVTFSGGEVMLQTSFLADLLNACKARGFHTVVDTAGNVPGAGFSEEILNGTDLFLFDIKAMSPELHKYCTGSENKLILQNIRSLSARGGAIWIRIPFIYGLTCSDEEIDMMSDFFLRLRGVERFELLAYHAYGESKYEALGKNCPYIPSENPPAEEMIGMVLARFAKKGINMECPALNKGR